MDIGNLNHKGNVVLPSGIPANYQTGRIGRKVSGPFDLNYPDLRKLQSSGCGIEGKGRLHVFRRLRAIFPFECGVSGSLLKEIQERRLEMPKRLLKWNTRNLIQPRESGIFFQFSQRLASFRVSNPKAIFPAFGTEIQPPIVNEPGATKGLPEQDFLLFGRVKPVVETKLHGLTKRKSTAKGYEYNAK
jgi:hypothetical protein